MGRVSLGEGALGVGKGDARSGVGGGRMCVCVWGGVFIFYRGILLLLFYFYSWCKLVLYPIFQFL